MPALRLSQAGVAYEVADCYDIGTVSLFGPIVLSWSLRFGPTAWGLSSADSREGDFDSFDLDTLAVGDCGFAGEVTLTCASTN
jgi:hypothetical protein